MMGNGTRYRRNRMTGANLPSPHTFILLFLLISCLDAFTAKPVFQKPGVPQLRSSSEAALLVLQSSSSTASTTLTKRDEMVQELLETAREVGQVGADASEENQEKVTALAKKLVPLSDKKPARIPLQGVHSLVYSASKGGSSGKIGPFVGRETQTFADNGVFFNKVQFGPLEISLRADCTVKNDQVCAVKFRETAVYLFGKTVTQKEVSGGGVWKYLFVGKVKDSDGTSKLVRVMETPSLFIIEQPL